MKDLIERQDAIEEIVRWIGYIDEDMILRIQTGLKKLPSAQRWIPLSERLPETGKEVFVYLWDDVPHLASVNSEGQWETDQFYLDADDTPKAWMPLPKPWKGEDG